MIPELCLLITICSKERGLLLNKYLSHSAGQNLNEDKFLFLAERHGVNGLACRGLLIRHLVMPGLLDESRAIFKWLAEEISPDTFINIMPQYRPEHRVGRDERYDDINRCPTRQELQAAREAAAQAGLWRFDER